MKKWFLLALLLSIYCTAPAQIALAKLKFEDAETAYNSGDYTKTIKKLEEAEKLFGKINPPILHLRILAEDKLLDKDTTAFTLLIDLQKNCKDFLQTYADVEGLEEKYKEVYRVSEKYASKPKTQQEVNEYLNKLKEARLAERALFKKILEKNVEAIGGEQLLQQVTTLSYDVELSGGLDLTNYKPATPGAYMVSYSESTKIEIGKRTSSEYKINKRKSNTYISNTEAYTLVNKVKTDLPQSYINSNKNELYFFTTLYLLNNMPDSIAVRESNIKGKAYYILEYKTVNKAGALAIDKSTFLVAEEISNQSLPNNQTGSVNMIINEYQTVSGIQFPKKAKLSINKLNFIPVVYKDIKINPKLDDSDFKD